MDCVQDRKARPRAAAPVKDTRIEKRIQDLESRLNHAQGVYNDIARVKAMILLMSQKQERMIESLQREIMALRQGQLPFFDSELG